MTANANANAGEALLQRYLGAYPDTLRAQVAALIGERRLDAHLQRKYPARHAIQSDAALYDYTLALKQQYLRSSPPLHKVVWQNRIDIMRSVLGLHTAISRVQGGRLKAKAEIRIASLFKEGPPEFLEMVVVHELAIARAPHAVTERRDRWMKRRRLRDRVGHRRAGRELELVDGRAGAILQRREVEKSDPHEPITLARRRGAESTASSTATSRPKTPSLVLPAGRARLLA